MEPISGSSGSDLKKGHLLENESDFNLKNKNKI